MEHKDWTEKIISSLEGMEKAKPGPNVLNGILNGLDNAPERPGQIPVIRQWKSIAAGILLLISLNATAIYLSIESNSQTEITGTDTKENNLVNPFNLY